jgi:hypothetical protein
VIDISYTKNGQVELQVEIDGDRVTKGELPSRYLARYEAFRYVDPEFAGIPVDRTLERYMRNLIDGYGNQVSLLTGTGWVPTSGLIDLSTDSEDERGDAELEIPDTPDLIIEKLQEDGAAVVKKWTKAIASWLNNQDSLESAAESLKKPADLYSKLDGKQFQESIYQSFILADLAGRLDVLEDVDRLDSVRSDAPRPEWLRLPFNEAIAYFRSKVSIPTKSFKKMEEGYHDFAFSITGLTKGSLLDDARWLIDKAIADGTSFDVFKKQWNRLIGRKGWEPKGDKNRRLYIIYDTNVRSAYGAGRGQQMSDPDVAAKRPYILWRHRDSPNPRVNHQQLDNKAIALSNPFWNKVNVPAGFSCRCGIFSVTKEYCDRNGIEILDNPPDPLSIAEEGFRRPLRGMSESDRQEVVSRTLDNLTPETRAIVEKELSGGGE